MPNPLIKHLMVLRIPLLLALGSILLYAGFAYDLVRTDFIKLISLYAALFFFSVKLVQTAQWNFRFLVIVGVLFRLVFLWATPNLSQDFYRFIWDGNLVINGLNPYLYTPNEILDWKQIPIANHPQLFEGMGELSAKHFSNYPPFNQALFAIAALFGGKSILGSVIVLRLQIILADIGLLYFGKKLLDQLEKPTYTIFWYFLNPLVIIELTGNLHFEGVMLFFMVWALYLILKKNWSTAAPLYALSILTKLLPILFLPLFLRFLGIKKSIGFYVLVIASCILLLLPFYNPNFVGNYGETIGLWFSNFEFNAGIYNLVKSIGVHFFDAKPWLLVKDYGSTIALLVVLATIGMAFFRKNEQSKTLMTSILFSLTLYFLLSSTVHPWYLVTLLFLGLGGGYRFVLVWTAVVFLSYSAYANPEYQENLWLLAVEYLIVFGFLFYEISRNKGNLFQFFKKSTHL
ncbi:MAG: glycosyltransferase 87 family protein [Bacteroidota bacterium]